MRRASRRALCGTRRRTPADTQAVPSGTRNLAYDPSAAAAHLRYVERDTDCEKSFGTIHDAHREHTRLWRRTKQLARTGCGGIDIVGDVITGALSADAARDRLFTGRTLSVNSARAGSPSLAWIRAQSRARGPQ